MDKDKLLLLLKKYASMTATKSEIEIVESYFEKLQQKNDWSDVEIDESLENKLYNKITRKAKILSATKNRRYLKTSYIHLMVFITLLCISIGVLYNVIPEENNVWIVQTTGKGQRLKTYLPDGSIVYLNVDSKLWYPKDFNTNEREVHFKGEAFFDIVAMDDKPFTIRTNELSTNVLGTSFNIKAYDDYPFELTVLSGKVALKRNNELLKDAIVKNEQLIYDAVSEKIIHQTIVANDYILWKDNILMLRNVDLIELTKLLERWYEVTIIIDEIQYTNCTISGKYKADYIENILEGIKYISNLEYEIIDRKHIKISGSLCDKN